MRHFEAPGLKPPPRCVDVRMFSMYVRMSRDHDPPYGVAPTQWELVRCRVLCSNRQTDSQPWAVRGAAVLVNECYQLLCPTCVSLSVIY